MHPADALFAAAFIAVAGGVGCGSVRFDVFQAVEKISFGADDPLRWKLEGHSAAQAFFAAERAIAAAYRVGDVAFQSPLEVTVPQIETSTGGTTRGVLSQALADAETAGTAASVSGDSSPSVVDVDGRRGTRRKDIELFAS